MGDKVMEAQPFSEVQMQTQVQPLAEVLRWGSQINAPSSQVQDQLRSGTTMPPPNAAEPLARWAANSTQANTYGPNQAPQVTPFAGTPKIPSGSATPPMPGRVSPGLVAPVLQAPNASSSAACCPHCGSPFMPDGNFCRRCGKKRAEPQGSLPSQQPAWRFPEIQNPVGPTFGAPNMPGIGFGPRMMTLQPPAAFFAGAENSEPRVSTNGSMSANEAAS